MAIATDFNISEIQALIFKPGPEPAPGVSNRYAPHALPPTVGPREYPDRDAVPSAGWTRRAVIPAGTEFVVRTIDPIDVRQPDPRQHFLASVERDVLDVPRRFCGWSSHFALGTIT
jgi:hypothetical protein